MMTWVDETHQTAQTIISLVHFLKAANLNQIIIDRRKPSRFHVKYDVGSFVLTQYLEDCRQSALCPQRY